MNRSACALIVDFYKISQSSCKPFINDYAIFQAVKNENKIKRFWEKLRFLTLNHQDNGTPRKGQTH